MVFKNRLLVLVFFAATSFMAVGQIAYNLSQFHNAPLLFNPAETGHFDGKFRASALYGDQWSLWKTIYASYEHNLGKSLTIGGGIFQDMTQHNSDARSKALGGELSLGIHFQLSETQKLTIAPNVSYFTITNGNLDMLAAPEDYSQETGQFDPANSNQETFSNYDAPSGISIDAGILYSGDFNGTRVDFGGFVANINRPSTSWIDKDESRVPMKVGANGGADFALTDLFHLTPKFMYETKLQTRESKYNFAGIGKYIVSQGTGVTALVFGPMFKTSGAISNLSMLGGAEFGNLAVNISYDFNLSASQLSDAQGFEFSLIYIGKAKPITICTRKVCPRF